MVPSIIENIFSKIFNFASKFASGKYWHLKVAVLCSVISLCFHFPNFTHGEKWMRDGINKQIEEPFVKQNYPPDSHLAKRIFRLTMPVVGNLLNLNITGLLVLQSILGFLFFIIVSKLVFSITSDNVLSLIVCVGFTVIYIGKSFLIDSGCFDGTAFFLLSLTMFFRKPLLIFTCIFLACFTDERAII
ncbi:MAG: hypothetical protein H0W84_10195, partial [Bacteroidetes bacterium]|nr:hypothetical protein [Bacteroidota bacterium]